MHRSRVRAKFDFVRRRSPVPLLKMHYPMRPWRCRLLSNVQSRLWCRTKWVSMSRRLPKWMSLSRVRLRGFHHHHCRTADHYEHTWLHHDWSFVRLGTGGQLKGLESATIDRFAWKAWSKPLLWVWREYRSRWVVFYSLAESNIHFRRPLQTLPSEPRWQLRAPWYWQYGYQPREWRLCGNWAKKPGLAVFWFFWYQTWQTVLRV